MTRTHFESISSRHLPGWRKSLVFTFIRLRMRASNEATNRSWMLSAARVTTLLRGGADVAKAPSTRVSFKELHASALSVLINCTPSFRKPSDKHCGGFLSTLFMSGHVPHVTFLSFLHVVICRAKSKTWLWCASLTPHLVLSASVSSIYTLYNSMLLSSLT